MSFKTRASKAPPKLQDLLECPSCNDIYEDPQILPCQHSICSPCVDQRSDDQLIECPVCEVTCATTELRRDVNKVQLLSICGAEESNGVDYASNMDFGSTSSIHEIQQKSVPYCDLCPSSQATCHCRQCNELLCSDCQTKHDRDPVTQLHYIDNLISVTKQRRYKLEKYHDIIRRGETRLTKSIQQIDFEEENIQNLQQRCLVEAREMKQEWVQNLCKYFDDMERRIMDFATKRLKELAQFRKRLSIACNTIKEQLQDLNQFLSQTENYVTSNSEDKARSIEKFMKGFVAPKLEIRKPAGISINIESSFEPSKVAALATESSIALTPVSLNRLLGDDHEKKVLPLFDKSEQRNGRNTNSRLSKLTPIPHSKEQGDCFRQISKAAFLLQSSVVLKSKPVSLRYIQGNIWCVHVDSISVWTIELKHIQTISHKLMEDVQNIAELKSGNLVVACGNGLHLIGKSGQYDGRITDECYVDIINHNGLLYAVTYGGGVRAKLHIYDELMNTERNKEDCWNILRTITLPCDGYVTIQVCDMVMYICSVDYALVYVTTLDGVVIRKCGHKGFYGGPGELAEPRICHVDFEGSILISDSGNGRLQVMNSEGDWSVATLNKPVKRPSCAYFLKRQLFVTQPEGRFKLFKFLA